MDLRMTFNEDEKNYDAVRPVYPTQLFTDIIDFAQLNEKSNSLEIGIGTGQATKPILQTGSSLTAIELGDKLSQFVKIKFEEYNTFTVINDDFMNCSIGANSFDLVYSATAFHWLPVKEGYEKVAHALKQGGTIALFWNHPFVNRKDDISNIANRKIYDKFRPSPTEIVEFSEKDGEKRIGELKLFGFADIESTLYHATRTLTSSDYISLLNTYSDHLALPLKIKNAFEAEMKIALDEIGGKITIYDTIDLYLARKA